MTNSASVPPSVANADTAPKAPQGGLPVAVATQTKSPCVPMAKTRSPSTVGVQRGPSPWPTRSSLAEREAKMGKFGADPEWLAARAKTEENGPIVASITNTLLTPTAFSSVK